MNGSCKTEIILKKLKKLESVGGAPIILSAAAARRQIFIGGGGAEEIPAAAARPARLGPLEKSKKGKKFLPGKKLKTW